MEAGKRKCRILKDIRRRIADANDIAFVTSRCKHRGNCLGTCPKCEDEIRYLEQQLLSRQKAGLSVKLVGVSLGMIALSSASLYGQKNMGDNFMVCHDSIPQVEIVGHRPIVKRQMVIAGGISTVGVKITGIFVEGIVVDKHSDPVGDAIVIEKGTTNEVTTDKDGHFGFWTEKKKPILIISYKGMRTKKMRVRLKNTKNIRVVMHQAWFTRNGKE